MLLTRLECCSRFAFNFCRKIPLVCPVFNFPLNAHRKAMKKFAFLFCLTMLPILLTVLMSPMVDPHGEYWVQFQERVEDIFSANVAEIFVYSAAFIPPLIFLYMERSDENRDSDGHSSRGMFPGYVGVMALSIGVLLVTSAAFASHKTGTLSETFLFRFLIDHGWVVFLFSLYAWYLSILDGYVSGDFVEQTRADEKDLSSRFQKRIGG